MTQEEFEAWLKVDPQRGNALLELMQETLREKFKELTPGQAEEMRGLIRQFEGEVSGFVVPECYNALVPRLRVLLAQKIFTDEEVDELRTADEKVQEFLDQALSMAEPGRTAAMQTLLHCQGEIRLVLQGLRKKQPRARRRRRRIDGGGGGRTDGE